MRRVANESAKAWNYKEFRQRFQWDSNPGVEPTMLAVDDEQTKLRYVFDDGNILTYTVKDFFDRKLHRRLPIVSPGELMAMDYPEFREFFQPENNPDVDPYKIKKWDTKPEIKYINQHKTECWFTPSNFFNNKLWNSLPNRKNEMAMDYPKFREFFQMENNPDVNPYEIRKWDDELKIKYINQHKTECWFTPYNFFCNSLWNSLPNQLKTKRAHREPELAMDYPEFREFFQQENNPDVDPYKIKKWDTKPEIKYINQHKTECWFTPYNFFCNSLWNSLPNQLKTKRAHREPELAMDYPEFREFFQPENNPDVDPYKIKKWDKGQKIKYINQHKTECWFTPYNFFCSSLWNSLPNQLKTKRAHIKLGMAMDYPEFREFFQPENNPDVDPYKIKKWDNELKIKYINQHKTECWFTPYNFFCNSLWNSLPNQLKTKRAHREPELAMDYPEFREFFQPENNPDIDPYKIKKWDKEQKILYINEYGVKTHFSPDRFFVGRLWESIPNRRPQDSSDTMINAIILDPEIAMFAKNEEEIEGLKDTTIYSQWGFRCPFCGEEFPRKLIKMVNVKPKCPFCKDTGIISEHEEEDSLDGAFLKKQ